MARKDAIKKYCGLSRRILACTMVGCMVFSFAGNVSVPVVYAVEAEEVTKVGNYTDDQGIKYKLYSDGTCEVNYSSGLKGDIILPENVTYNDKNYRITSNTKPGSNTDPGSDTDLGSNTKPGSNTKSGSNTNSGSNTKSGSNTDPRSNTNPGSNTDTSSNHPVSRHINTDNL